MKLDREAAILLSAVDCFGLATSDLIRWADRKISLEDSPPYWLIELSTLNSKEGEDYLSILRSAAFPISMSANERISFLIGGYQDGLGDLTAILSELWKVWAGPEIKYEEGSVPETVVDVLVEWDCLDDISRIPKHLSDRCDKVFVEHLKSNPPIYGELKAIKSRQGEQDAAPQTRPRWRVGD